MTHSVLEPKRVLVSPPGKTPHFRTVYRKVDSDTALSTRHIHIIQAKSFRGDLNWVFVEWNRFVGSYHGEQKHHIMMPLLALQEILYKDNHKGLLAVIDKRVVGVASFVVTDNQLEVSMLTPAPQEILDNKIASIQAMLRQGIIEHAKKKGLQVAQLQEEREDYSVVNQLVKWLQKQSKQPPRPGLVPKKVPVHRRGGVISAVRWVRPEEGQVITPGGTRIPPSWTDVKINPDPKADLQVIGVDRKGVTQYRYSKEHSKKSDAEKFARLKDFDRALPKLRKKISRDIGRSQEAQILYLIDKTGFRVGSEKETFAEEKAYGASTLLGQHVIMKGDRMSFKFTAKKGQKVRKTVKDKILAKIIAKYKREDDTPLFQADHNQVRNYLKGVIGDDFSTKDLRTWHGTNLALKEIEKHATPQSKRDYQKQRKAVAKVVSKWLGNTPDVALGAYIAPEVFSRWKAAVEIE